MKELLAYVCPALGAFALAMANGVDWHRSLWIGLGTGLTGNSAKGLNGLIDRKRSGDKE